MAQRKNDVTPFTGLVKFSTAKAVLFHIDGMKEPTWLPRSQINITMEEDADEEGRAIIEIPKWLSRKGEFLDE